MNILVIDDSNADFEIYSNLLSKIYPYCNIMHNISAEEAVETLKNNKYDLILLDYNMPGMTGVDFISGLKLLDIDPDCPIIAVAGCNDSKTVMRFIRLGVADYIYKYDISEDTFRIIINNALETYQKQRAEIERQKELSNFAFALAHDLKSPINRIFAYSKLIGEKNNNLDKKKFLDRISEDAQYVVDFTDNLLEFAESGASNSTYELIELRKIIEQVQKNLELEIAESKADIIIHGNLGKISGNKVSLIRLFQNLVSNSIKYNSNKPVIEILSVISNDCIIVKVQDNGIGIDINDVDLAFKPLVRIPNKLDKPGTGLGLALCKSIANNHSAKIGIMPRKNGGSEVILEFPYIFQD